MMPRGFVHREAGVQSGRSWSPTGEGRPTRNISTLPVWCQGAEEAFGSRTCLHRVWSHHYQRPCKRGRNTQARTEPSTGNGGAVMLLWVEKPAPLGDGVVTFLQVVFLQCAKIGFHFL